MKKKSPFYKTGPAFLGRGGILATDSLDSSSDSSAEAKALMDEYGESGIAATEYNKSKSSSNKKDKYKNIGSRGTESAVSENNELLGRNIATGKGSGKINSAIRKLDKATMQAEGKSRLEVRQAKTKSKMADTKAQLQHLTESSGGKNQGKIDRLQAKLKVQTARDKRMTGRKAKREALKNYGK